MICQCGEYANASVVGKNGGRVPVCDSCIALEPNAVYRIPNHPHVTTYVSTGRPTGRPPIDRAMPKPSAPAVLALPEWAKQGR